MTNPLFFSTNGHYYQFVAASGITWQQAKTLAEAQTYNGMSGYLATVTTFAERNFIDGIVFGSGRPDNTYIGGSDANQEGVWRWVTGPEALENSGLGKLFYNQSTGTNYTDIPSSDLWIGGATPSGNTSTNDFLYMYSFFDPSFNPSNNSIGSPGSGGPAGYLIEYGGNTNTAPAITSAATASTAENVSTTTAIYTATATDPDAGATLTYSLSGGVDAALFNINASTGAVTFKASPNFEAPTDSGANNVYDITVQASDGALTASKAVAITVTDVVETTAPTLSFAAIKNYATGNWPHAVAISDVNGDGYADLITPNEFSNSISVLLGQGSGTFATAISYAAGSAPQGIAVGDFNRDGKTDVVVSNAGTNQIAILLNNGAGTFSAPVKYSVAAGPITVAVADFNDDGLLDIASNSGTLLFGNGAGVFGQASSFASGAGGNYVTSGDLNGDGKPDIVTSGNGATVYLNNGSGTFTKNATYNTGAVSVAVGDLNSDGKKDVATADISSNTATVLLNTGSGTLTKLNSYQAGPSPGWVSIADMNGDGLNDLIVADQGAAQLQVLLADGTGGFGSALSYQLPSMSYFATAADLNGDGKLDMLAADASANVVSVFLNTTSSTKNSAPTITSAAAASTAENLSTTTAVYTATATDPDAGTTLTYSISGGADANLFNINASSGAVTFKASPNFEAPTDSGANNVYDITVRASDGTLYADKAVTISVTDVNEGLAITAHNALSASSSAGQVDKAYHFIPGAGFSVNGHTYLVTNQGYATSVNIDTAITSTYGVSARMASWQDLKADFTASTSGPFMLALALPVETVQYGSYPNLFVSNNGSEMDGSRGRFFVTNFTGTTPASVNYSSFDSIGSLYLGSYTWSGQALVCIDNSSIDVASVSENVSTTAAIYTVAATRQNGGATITYSISGGADAALFNINSATGAVTFKTSPNFEAPADSGANNVYDIIVQASDGSSTATRALEIAVTDVVEAAGASTAPTITSGAAAPIAENVATTTTVYTATATDPDAGTTLTYSISGGVDAALFNINASTGAVTFKASPNFEAPTDSGANNVYDITVQASDGALTASKAVAITVTDVFETPPTFKFTSSATLGVNENVSVGGSIYGAAASIPGVDGTVVYSVSGGADAASFAIDAATGALSFKYSPDYEAAGDAGANNVYELGLRAVETTAAPISAEIQIRNALWSAAGQVTAEVWAKASSLEGFDLVIGATGGSGLSFSQAALSGWTVMPNTTNEEVLVSGYSLAPLGTGPVLLGTISAQATGAEFHLLIKDGTDAQAAANMVKVTPYDIAFYQATQALAITVNNVNEAPVITSASSASTPENALTSQAVYTATATDPDANTTFTYSISGGADASLFQIDSHTGAVTFKASPDFEGPADAGTNNVYDITIRASDGVLYAEKAVAINVTDVLDSGSLHGETYFWKANASGQHALLSGVTVNAAGGNQPSEGGNAPIQLKNITWDVSGHATADIYAHVTGSADSFDLHLGFGGATGINFTLALSSDWTLLTNQVQNEYLISGYSMTPLGAGDVKLGSVAFETGQLAQTHIGVDAGSRMGSVTATAYGYSLAHDTSGSSGVYSITPRRQSSQARG